MAEFVTIKHPSLEGSETARVTREALEGIHRHKGWEVVGDAPATATPNVPSLSIAEQIELANAARAQQQASVGETTEDRTATRRQSSARKEDDK